MTVSPSGKNTYTAVLIVTVSIFFFWGFAASGNALLIPVLKKQFFLSQFQSQMVELSFYLAYFTGSLIYFLILLMKPAFIYRYPPQKIMIAGLLISCAGTILIALFAGSGFGMVLVSLFIIALGFSLQQIIANPLLVQLGGELFGAHRLILAGAVNSFGNTLAPLVMSYFLFGDVPAQEALSLSAIRPLFLAIAALYLLFAIFYRQVNLPAFTGSDQVGGGGFHLLHHRPLLKGMAAIFAYVGCEVTLQSNLPALVASHDFLNLQTRDAIHYFSLFGGSLMIGRWGGAVYNFKCSKVLTQFLTFIVPFAAFAIVLLANWLKGTHLPDILDYAPYLFFLVAILLLSGTSPQRLLLLSTITSILLILASFIFTGKTSLYLIIAIANFTALMWPCIFMISIKGLGNDTSKGSVLLIMMIAGGAIIPPMQGLLADQPGIGIHYSFLLPVMCLLYITWFAVTSGKVDSSPAK